MSNPVKYKPIVICYLNVLASPLAVDHLPRSSIATGTVAPLEPVRPFGTMSAR